MVIANTAEFSMPDAARPSFRAGLHPRGGEHQPACSGGEGWQGKLGLVMMEDEANHAGGNSLNEAGLSVSVHAFRSGGTYMPDNATMTLCAGDLAIWIATTFEKVAELREILPTVAIADASGQLAIADASGQSVVVDYAGGTLHLHDNSGVGVMTNNPEYSWQLQNLNNYVGLQKAWPDGNENGTCDSEVGKVPIAVGHGQNLLGLPGDLSPPSRFVRTFFMRNYALQARPPMSLNDVLVLASGVLDTQTIMKGFNAKLPSESGYDATQYCTLHVPASRLLFYRSYEDSRWRRVNLSALDFSRAGATQPGTAGAFGAIDVTGEIGSAGDVV